MAAVSDRLSRAIPFNALKPFDRQQCWPISYRRAAARRLISPLFTASITRSRKSCEYGFGIPAGLRPANRLNQNLPDLGIPLRFDPSAARSKGSRRLPGRKSDS